MTDRKSKDRMHPQRTILGRYHNAFRRSAISEPPINMAHIILAVYLILVGLNILIGLNLPAWVMGVAALAAGILLLAERFGITAHKK